MPHPQSVTRAWRGAIAAFGLACAATSGVARDLRRVEITLEFRQMQSYVAPVATIISIDNRSVITISGDGAIAAENYANGQLAWRSQRQFRRTGSNVADGVAFAGQWRIRPGNALDHVGQATTNMGARVITRTRVTIRDNACSVRLSTRIVSRDGLVRARNPAGSMNVINRVWDEGATCRIRSI